MTEREEQTKSPVKEKWRWKLDPYLLVILLLALFLYGWNIWKADSANSFYTAAITSRTQSFKNFWYASFDPAGYITVDKPPVALWFMAISAKIFGVHGWSVVLPSVLFGLGSVYLMYRLIQPYFGKLAGRLAALAMTLTPIVVADSRTNNMDATLIFFLLLALLLLEKAVVSNKAWWVMASFALVGIAFNVKMLQAFMMLPAMYLFYWVAAQEKWSQKIKKLALGTSALVVFTLAWPLSVDLTNSSSRPYVGGSENNSVLELAFGYNGSERLLGQSTGTGGSFGQGMNGNKKRQGPSGNKKKSRPTKTQNGVKAGKQPNKAMKGMGGQKGGLGPGNPGNQKGKAGGGGGAFAIGTAGPLRIFQSDLGPQIAWLLPFALFGLVGGFAYYHDKNRKWYYLSQQQKQMLLWTGWLVPVYGFFSIASFFHPYYMIMLAPAIAALFGIGGYVMIQMNRTLTRTDWKFYLLPLAILTTAGLQAWYVYSYYPWLTYILLALGLGFASALVLVHDHLTKKLAVAGGIAAIMLSPGWWSLTPTLAAESSAIPTAGPDLLSNGANGSAGGMGDSNVNTQLLKYLEKHQGNAKYLMGTNDSNSAAPYIIKSGKAVMALGGYNGTDEALTLKQFKHLVKTGQIKYFYISGKTASASSGQIGKIIQWIKQNGNKVSANKYGGTSNTAANATKNRAGAVGNGNQMGQGPGSIGKQMTPNTKQQGTPPTGMQQGQKPAKPSSRTGKTKAAQGKMKTGGGNMGGMQSGVLYDLSSIY